MEIILTFDRKNVYDIFSLHKDTVDTSLIFSPVLIYNHF